MSILLDMTFMLLAAGVGFIFGAFWGYGRGIHDGTGTDASDLV